MSCCYESTPQQSDIKATIVKYDSTGAVLWWRDNGVGGYVAQVPFYIWHFSGTFFWLMDTDGNTVFYKTPASESFDLINFPIGPITYWLDGTSVVMICSFQRSTDAKIQIGSLRLDTDGTITLTSSGYDIDEGNVTTSGSLSGLFPLDYGGIRQSTGPLLHKHASSTTNLGVDSAGDDVIAEDVMSFDDAGGYSVGAFSIPAPTLATFTGTSLTPRAGYAGQKVWTGLSLGGTPKMIFENGSYQSSRTSTTPINYGYQDYGDLNAFQYQSTGGFCRLASGDFFQWDTSYNITGTLIDSGDPGIGVQSFISNPGGSSTVFTQKTSYASTAYTQSIEKTYQAKLSSGASATNFGFNIARYNSGYMAGRAAFSSPSDLRLILIGTTSETTLFSRALLSTSLSNVDVDASGNVYVGYSRTGIGSSHINGYVYNE